MTEKGLVTRDTSERSHVYQVSRPEGDTKKQLVKGLLERAFGGSAMDLVVRALEAAPASKEEREQIRKILDAMEETQE
jgi:predicted transcriptional regulator